MLTQRNQVRKWFIESKMKANIQRKVGWSDPESRSRIKRGGALPVKYSKYFGAKRHGFIKSKSVLAPKGAILLLYENIRYDISSLVSNLWEGPKSAQVEHLWPRKKVLFYWHQEDVAANKESIPNVAVTDLAKHLKKMKGVSFIFNSNQ
jgi:hypothetical protein